MATGYFERRKKFRFSHVQDVLLLRAVIAVNPFSFSDQRNQKSQWCLVAQHLNDSEQGFHVDHRLCREHTDLLITKFRKDNGVTFKRAGMDEIHSELLQLLKELIQLITDQDASAAETKTLVITQAKESEQLKADDILKGLAIETTGSKPRETEEQVSIKRRGDSIDALMKYLEKRNKDETDLKREELQLRREELELEKRKMALEEQRMQIEKQERENRMKLETEERSLILQVLKEKLGMDHQPDATITHDSTD